MIDSIVILISALREELGQYGEMLALLDRQQQQVVARGAEELLHTVARIKAQGVAIQQARDHREKCRGELAQVLQQSEQTTFASLIPLLPADYRPLVSALVAENNELLVRVRRRVRQNHILLSRSIDLMQNLINTLVPARETRIYNGQGSMNSRRLPRRALYEAVG
ncbi:MAG TPA: flagellar export chaperone FlgN [Candidatus Saccharimonadales bacterium]|nr:flagellar export chaperone FlgN [Candidatus Saccharimonadales bacterium]